MVLPGTITVAAPRQRLTKLTRQLYSSPPGRKRITLSRGPSYMPQGNDFSPMDTTELVTQTFDFGPWLLSGVSIQSITSVTCQVYMGTDAAASSRLVGSPATTTSPTTGAATAAVLQQIGNTPVAGVIYRLDATVVTSDGQTLNLWAHQPVQSPD